MYSCFWGAVVIVVVLPRYNSQRPSGNLDPNSNHPFTNRTVETNIKNKDYDIIINFKPLIETFIGENNVIYENMYYIGICKNILNIKIDRDNRNQVIEVKNVELMTEKECLDNIRDYNISKKEIIIDIYNFIKEYKKDFLLK